MFRINFKSDEGWRRWNSPRVVVFLLLLFALQAVGYWFIAAGNLWLIAIFICFLTIQAIAITTVLRQRYFIESNGRVLSYNVSLGFRKRHSLPWNSIRSVRVGPAYIRLNLINNKKKQILLGWVTYHDLRDAKALVIMECERMGKPYTIAKLAD